MKQSRKLPTPLGLCLAASFCMATVAVAQSGLERARAHQQAGQTAQLRAAVAEVLRQSPQDPAVLLAAAELLDLSGSPDRAQAYRRVLEAAPSPESREAKAARRRLILLYLQAGKYPQAQRELEVYHRAGGSDLPGWSDAAAAPLLPVGYIEIPGPLLPFQRMAAIRPQTPPEELLPALARNLVSIGYQYSHLYMKIAPTEYLKLLLAYLKQARELQALGDSDGLLSLNECEQAEPLLQILGYRLRGAGCAAGPKAGLEVDDPVRAFLTSDSAFPLVQLEEAIQGKRPFEHSVRSTQVPVLLGPEAWVEPGTPWIDALLEDRLLARFYVAVSCLPAHTLEALRQDATMEQLKPLSPVLDFFGRMLRVQGGSVVVPGGAAANQGWKGLADARPDRPGAFLLKLLEKDNGWLAAYFDALSRTGLTAQSYFTDSKRLARFYHALRGKDATPGPARPVFRNSAPLLLLVTRLRVQADGRPFLPGGVETWDSIFRLRPSKSGDKGGRARLLRDPDGVVEALFGHLREADENGLLNVFLAINEIDRLRAKPLAPDTVLLLMTQYPRFSQHYFLFAEWPHLSDSTIERFLEVLESLTQISEPLVRADGLGSLQAVVALWEILARQEEIPESKLEPTLQRLIEPFADANKAEEVLDAALQAVQTLLSFAPPEPSSLQEKMIGLLAAPSGLDGTAQRARDEVAGRIRAALDDQRLVPLDTLFTLAEKLERAATTQSRPDPEFTQLASRLKELNLPNPFPTAVERRAAFFGYWAERHINAEREADLAGVAKLENPEKLARALGLLTPHLRDTLVGLVYAYYAPPGSMVLRHNPLFVRSHDFLGDSGRGTGNETRGPGHIYSLGWPWSGGGRFIGSLSGVAYALADAEKDFLVPQQTQSLIWGDLAPQMLLSSVVPRWWRVSARTQHWVALHLRLGQDLLAEAAASVEARQMVLNALPTMEAQRRERIEAELARGRAAHALRLVNPAELYQLSRNLLAGARSAAGAELARRVGPAAAALEQMSQQFPQEASETAASSAFGVPHPKIARSYRPELLHLPLFPALMGYSSRLLAESWESSNLYWAQLADELALPPAELNRIVPQLTRQMLERIFANHLEDWPAMLTAMRATGEEFRRKALAEAASPALAAAGP